MGERTVETCDIFDTLQPKGLRVIEVHVAEFVAGGPDAGKVAFDAKLEVGERGLKRVLRMVKAATMPYAKTQTATKGKAAGDA